MRCACVYSVCVCVRACGARRARSYMQWGAGASTHVRLAFSRWPFQKSPSGHRTTTALWSASRRKSVVTNRQPILEGNGTCARKSSRRSRRPGATITPTASQARRSARRAKSSDCEKRGGDGGAASFGIGAVVNVPSRRSRACTSLLMSQYRYQWHSVCDTETW